VNPNFDRFLNVQWAFTKRLQRLAQIREIVPHVSVPHRNQPVPNTHFTAFNSACLSTQKGSRSTHERL
jgi:hypothetical protein